MASWWILKWTHSIFWHVHYFAPVTVGPSLHLAPGTCQTTCLIFHVAFVPSRTTCLGASKSQHVSKPWCSRKNINVEGAGSRIGPEGMKVLQTLLYIHRLSTDPLWKLILMCNGTLYCFSNIHVTSLKIFVFQRPNPMSLSIYIRSIVMKGKPMMDTDLFDSLNDSFELTHKRSSVKHKTLTFCLRLFLCFYLELSLTWKSWCDEGSFFSAVSAATDGVSVLSPMTLLQSRYTQRSWNVTPTYCLIGQTDGRQARLTLIGRGRTWKGRSSVVLKFRDSLTALNSSQSLSRNLIKRW